ncbi:FHA_domain-containing protein [Hexamita inflata]|uniref:FHA_domain-containing protein n=1 Tax=Hexamita inflata TaxID=28002 RepID=A0ABP1HLB5_9EUKA
MSHLDFIKKIKEVKTENRFKLYNYIPETLEQIEFKSGYQYCLIGRHTDCNIQAEKDNCSRFHAVLYFVEDSLNIRDLDSRQGTYLAQIHSGKIISREKLASFAEQPLKEGDVFIIADQCYKIGEITIPNAAVAKQLDLQTKKCAFCDSDVQVYKAELESVCDHLGQLSTDQQKMQAQLTREELKANEILEKLSKIKEAHTIFMNKDLVATIGVSTVAEQQVLFDSAVQIINPEAEKKTLKNAKQHKPTPFKKGVSYEDDE